MRRIAIDDSRPIDGVTPDTKLAGLSLRERAVRTIQKSDDCEVVKLDAEHDIVLDYATVYSRNQFEPQHRIESSDDLRRVEEALWQGCRKPVDGIISTHHNRYISLFFSRRLARFNLSPNYISIVTFSLGVAAGVLASLGHYWSFFLGGFLFHMASVLDGVDGELARVKLEFSVLGEWLDTISDDTSDVLYYGGLGIGAYVAGLGAGPIPPVVFLVLGVAAVVGKLCSMALYYTILIRKKRGDLYAFEWSFDQDTSDTLGARLARGLRYVTKNDFIAFAAFVLAALGVGPWLLLAAAPGTWVVVASVATQMRSQSRSADN